MATWEDVEARGYSTVECAPGVRCVTRDGVLIYVREDDQATIDMLANPAVPEEVELAGAAMRPSPLEAIAALDPKTATAGDVIVAVQAALDA